MKAVINFGTFALPTTDYGLTSFMVPAMLPKESTSQMLAYEQQAIENNMLEPFEQSVQQTILEYKDILNELK